MDSGKQIPVPEIQERSCSHRVRVTLHEVNKCMIVSLGNLHREHNGLVAILNLNNFSFRYKILFSILYWNEHNDDSIVTCLGSIQTFVQSTLFNLNRLFKDLCTVGGFTMFFKSIWYAIPVVTLSLSAVGTLLSAARISIWSLESMLFHFLGILFIRSCQSKINELFSEYIS